MVFDTTSGCSGPYMGLVPSNPNPDGTDYLYSTDSGGTTYTLIFTLVGQTGGLSSGLKTASPNGFQ